VIVAVVASCHAAPQLYQTVNTGTLQYSSSDSPAVMKIAKPGINLGNPDATTSVQTPVAVVKAALPVHVELDSEEDDHEVLFKSAVHYAAEDDSEEDDDEVTFKIAVPAATPVLTPVVKAAVPTAVHTVVQAPVVKAAVPVVKAAVPVVKAAVPVVKTAVPVVKAAVPATTSVLTPVVKAAVPAAVHTVVQTPVVQAAAPAVVDAPVVKAAAPVTFGHFASPSLTPLFKAAVAPASLATSSVLPYSGFTVPTVATQASTHSYIPFNFGNWPFAWRGSQGFFGQSPTRYAYHHVTY